MFGLIKGFKKKEKRKKEDTENLIIHTETQIRECV